MLQQQRYIALYCYTFVAQLNYPAYCVAVVCCTRCYSRHYRSLAADALPLATHCTHQRHNANGKYVVLMCVCVWQCDKLKWQTPVAWQLKRWGVRKWGCWFVWRHECVISEVAHAKYAISIIIYFKQAKKNAWFC